MATTILDRLMHRCTMLEFESKSYRLKEAAARIALSPESSNPIGLAWGNLGWPHMGEFELAIWVPRLPDDRPFRLLHQPLNSGWPNK